MYDILVICHIVNFFYLHPPSKFKIYNITNEKSYDRRQPCGCLEAQTIVRISQQKYTCRETGASFTKLTYD